MTKIFDCISLNGYLYMVDEGAKIRNDEYGIINHPRTGLGIMPNHEVPTSDNGIMRAYDFWKVNEGKIVASNDPSLTDIPKIGELPDENEAEAVRLSYIAVPEGEEFSDRDRQFWQDGFLSSKKQFTKEEVRKALRMSRELEDGYDGTYYDKYTEDEIMESLKPVPKKVWLELENDIPLIENGYVKINRVEY